MLIFGYVTCLVLVILGYYVQKKENVPLLNVSLIFVGILFLFLAISCFTDGIVYKTGFTETLVNNTTVHTTYTYSNSDTEKSYYGLILGIVSILLAALCVIGAIYVTTNSKKKEKSTY